MDKRFKVIFKAITGSHLYGTNMPESDKDVRGVFIPTEEFYLGFLENVEQVESHTPGDIDYQFDMLEKISKLPHDPSRKELDRFCRKLIKTKIENDIQRFNRSIS